MLHPLDVSLYAGEDVKEPEYIIDFFYVSVSMRGSTRLFASSMFSADRTAESNAAATGTLLQVMFLPSWRTEKPGLVRWAFRLDQMTAR